MNPRSSLVGSSQLRISEVGVQETHEIQVCDLVRFVGSRRDLDHWLAREISGEGR
jgi:hypothetical protein